MELGFERYGEYREGDSGGGMRLGWELSIARLGQELWFLGGLFLDGRIIA